MSRWGRCALWLWVLIAPRLAAGTVYYVATNGSDSYSGLSPSYTSGTTGPFRTLSHACTKLKAGDSVLMRGGAYHDAIDFEINGTATQPITISNYNGESPILDGEYTLPTGSVFYFLVKIIGDYVTFSNINIQRSAGGGLALGGRYDQAMNVVVNGARETGIGLGGSYNTINGCTSTDSGNGFGINGQNSWGSGINVQGTGNVVRNCVSYENRGEGLNACKGSTNALFQGNTVYDNRSYNLYVDSAYGTKVCGNLVYQTKPEYLMYGITIGAETSMPSEINIYNNLVTGCLANFHVDSNVTSLYNVRVAYNTFVNSVGGVSDYIMGVYYRNTIVAFSDCIFENNIVEEDDSSRVPISVPSSHSGLTFSHNCWNKTPVAAARGTGDVIANPLLAKSGSTAAGSLSPNWFKIAVNSPACDAAMVLGDVTDDFFGTPRGDAPDIGACEVYIGGTPLTASASGSPTRGQVPLNVNFTGSASGGVSPYSYQWTFGDGGTSSSQNPSHTYSSAGNFTATLTVTDYVLSTSPSTVIVNILRASGAIKADFNGDGKEDLLWRCYAGAGSNSVWYIGSSAAAPANAEGSISDKAAVKTKAADLFRGRPQRVFRDPREAGGSLSGGTAPQIFRDVQEAAAFPGRGALGPREARARKSVPVMTSPEGMGGVASGASPVMKIATLLVTGSDWLPTVADLNWEIAGVGDFNGDGKVDILWRNYSQGTNVVWYMDGVTLNGPAWLPTVTDTNWRIAGTGDFNGDGKVDILWRNYSQGTNVVWYMDGVTLNGPAWLPTVTDTNWKIEGTGDFNGDGKVDILWRNYSQGTNVVWYMNGVTLNGPGWLPTVSDTNWRIEGTGDFDGDGKLEILWRNYGAGLGYDVVWHMDGVTLNGPEWLPTVSDTNWRIENH